jgi:hypothetical protein
MKIKPVIMGILACFMLAACNLTQNSSEKLLEDFTMYTQERNLDIQKQTIPQTNENIVLAFYETTDDKFGIVEFDNNSNLTKEVDKNDITLASLAGNYGNYVAVQHSNEILKDVKKVNLYKTTDKELVEEFDLKPNESLSFFILEDASGTYEIEFIDKDNNKLDAIEFAFE